MDLLGTICDDPQECIASPFTGYQDVLLLQSTGIVRVSHWADGRSWVSAYHLLLNLNCPRWWQRQWGVLAPNDGRDPRRWNSNSMAPSYTRVRTQHPQQGHYWHLCLLKEARKTQITSSRRPLMKYSSLKTRDHRVSFRRRNQLRKNFKMVTVQPVTEMKEGEKDTCR